MGTGLTPWPSVQDTLYGQGHMTYLILVWVTWVSKACHVSECVQVRRGGGEWPNNLISHLLPMYIQRIASWLSGRKIVL